MAYQRISYWRYKFRKILQRKSVIKIFRYHLETDKSNQRFYLIVYFSVIILVIDILSFNHLNKFAINHDNKMKKYSFLCRWKNFNFFPEIWEFKIIMNLYSYIDIKYSYDSFSSSYFMSEWFRLNMILTKWLCSSSGR